MIDKEILKKIIEQATKNGFKYDTQKNTMIIPQSFMKKNGLLNILLFNHDFAKAYFGNEWRYHLQQLVLEKNPLEYFDMFY